MGPSLSPWVTVALHSDNRLHHIGGLQLPTVFLFLFCDNELTELTFTGAWGAEFSEPHCLTHITQNVGTPEPVGSRGSHRESSRLGEHLGHRARAPAGAQPLGIGVGATKRRA